MTRSALESERAHLAGILDAIQRCVYFLHASDRKTVWPLAAQDLQRRKKDIALFESLAAINERFAKLQDTLGAAMRHATLLAGEPAETFLKVLSFQEKIGVLDSLQSWQLCRTTRNLAAHDYETDYAEIADHFNSLHALTPGLYGVAARFLDYCRNALDIRPERPGHSAGTGGFRRRIHRHRPNRREIMRPSVVDVKQRETLLRPPLPWAGEGWGEGDGHGARTYRRSGWLTAMTTRFPRREPLEYEAIETGIERLRSEVAATGCIEDRYCERRASDTLDPVVNPHLARAALVCPLSRRRERVGVRGRERAGVRVPSWRARHSFYGVAPCAMTVTPCA